MFDFFFGKKSKQTSVETTSGVAPVVTSLAVTQSVPFTAPVAEPSVVPPTAKVPQTSTPINQPTKDSKTSLAERREHRKKAKEAKRSGSTQVRETTPNVPAKRLSILMNNLMAFPGDDPTLHSIDDELPKILKSSDLIHAESDDESGDDVNNKLEDPFVKKAIRIQNCVLGEDDIFIFKEISFEQMVVPASEGKMIGKNLLWFLAEKCKQGFPEYFVLWCMQQKQKQNCLLSLDHLRAVSQAEEDKGTSILMLLASAVDLPEDHDASTWMGQQALLWMLDAFKGQFQPSDLSQTVLAGEHQGKTVASQLKVAAGRLPKIQKFLDSMSVVVTATAASTSTSTSMPPAAPAVEAHAVAAPAVATQVMVPPPLPPLPSLDRVKVTESPQGSARAATLRPKTTRANNNAKLVDMLGLPADNAPLTARDLGEHHERERVKVAQRTQSHTVGLVFSEEAQGLSASSSAPVVVTATRADIPRDADDHAKTKKDKKSTHKRSNRSGKHH